MTRKIEIKNAQVLSCEIGYDENQKLTGWLVCNINNAARQGFGGLDLNAGNNATVFLNNVLQVVGGGSLEDLKGKAVRIQHKVVTDDEGNVDPNATSILAIGNFMLPYWYVLDKAEIIQKDVPDEPAETETVVVDMDGKKHYGMKAEPGAMGAEFQK